METLNELRNLPSVDQLLKEDFVVDLTAGYGRRLVVEAVRDVLNKARADYASSKRIPEQVEILKAVKEQVETWVAPTLKGVINATGVILHTNLGRAPLSEAAIRAAQLVGTGYSNLEFDLGRGKRGSRLIHAESYLQRLTGAEAALVVNNNASAVMLVLSGLARRRGVVISRSQLVEIGGGFRVPDVMKQSGARLIEVGTTNRVHLSDYENALEQKPALFMRAHRSNFRILGFTSEPTLKEIARVAHTADIPLMDDLGSGAFLDTSRYGLGHEPMVQESLAAGADLVCFSGDKLVGGPQAGIIIGKQKYVAKLKKHPLARAIRADKLCLSALSETLLHYLKDEAEQKVPVWQMISMRPDAIKKRAQEWQRMLQTGDVIEATSTVGGGSLPGETLPTYVLALKVQHPDRLMRRLRSNPKPIIARLENNLVLLDPRTVFQAQETELLEGIRRALDDLQKERF